MILDLLLGTFLLLLLLDLVFPGVNRGLSSIKGMRL